MPSANVKLPLQINVDFVFIINQHIRDIVLLKKRQHSCIIRRYTLHCTVFIVYSFFNDICVSLNVRKMIFRQYRIIIALYFSRSFWASAVFPVCEAPVIKIIIAIILYRNSRLSIRQLYHSKRIIAIQYSHVKDIAAIAVVHRRKRVSL